MLCLVLLLIPQPLVISVSVAFSIKSTTSIPSASSSSSASTSNHVIEQSTWMYKGHPIAYERSYIKDKVNNTDKTPILLLNGFGMGTFHQHRLMEAVHSQNVGRTIYGIDYLGQGKSWPIDCDDGNSEREQGLRYSASTWIDQIADFVTNNLQSRVHLVGNSIGGYLAVFVASQYPDNVESVVLLNATPIWGLNLPGWSGHLPVPTIPRLIGRYLFDRMRDERTIRNFLETTYANPSAFDDNLIQQVKSCTDGAGGHAAFASILWSPPAGKFYQAIENVQCDVLLCFGREDPWCKPAFARKILEHLERRSSGTSRYVELSSVGHCPQHEAPNATATVLAKWLENGDRRSVLGGGGDDDKSNMIVQEAWGETILTVRKADEVTLNFIDSLVTRFL